MSVWKNIGYPLRTRGIKGPHATEWTEEVAALVDTTPLLDRYPAQLSGGQQQRIALARRLAAPLPLVLFALRHARRGRGASTRRPPRDHARRRSRAARDARRDLRRARDPVRRVLHRHVEPTRVPPPRRRLVSGRRPRHR